MHAYYKDEKFNIAKQRPYTSSDKRYICTFEGSLVNEQELHKKLKKTGIYILSTRPEEIILELYRFCGDSFTKVLRGKFAIIIFDKKLEQLIVARDRYGVRPLYYKLVGSGIEITSELTNFKPSKGCPISYLNSDSLRHYFSYGYIPENETYLKNVYHLPAGCILKYDTCGLAITPFADMLAIEGSNDQLVDEQLFSNVVTEAIHVRIPSEKKIGVFYTGKTSELVITATAKQAASDVKVFSVEFRRRLRPVSKALKESLTRLRISADDYWRATANAIRAMDLPIADPSAPIDYLLAELASKYVDVIISADGANILFGTDESWIKRLTRKDGLIFTETQKEQLLKFAGNPWSEVVDPYKAQISDLDNIAKWQTLALNMRLMGSTVLKRERSAAHHGLEVRFPFLDDKILDIASFLTNDEKKSMLLFNQTFASQISKFQISKKLDLDKILNPHKIPLAKWIRTDLYEDIKCIIDQDITEQFFNTEVVFEMLEQHRKGFRDLSHQIWTIVVFLIWMQNIRGPRGIGF